MEEIKTSRANPKISVVIPTFNKSRLLSKAIIAVLSQKFSDFELLIIDDASTDNTSQEVSSFEDRRIKYIRNEKNSGGPAIPMSIGARAARADLVAFLDHDDQPLPNWLESLYKVISQNEKLGLVWGQNAIVDGKGQRKSVAFRNPFGKAAPQKLPTLLYWTPGASGLIVRKSVFEEVGYFDQHAWSLCDFDFTFGFAAKSSLEVGYVPEIVLNYYVHDSNMSQGALPKQVEALKYVLNKHKAALNPYPEIHAKFIYKLVWSIGEIGDTTQALEYISQAISLDPKNRKYKVFRFLTKYHCFRYIRPLSAFRAWIGGKIRLFKARYC